MAGARTWDPQRQQEVVLPAGGKRIPYDCVTELGADGAGTGVHTASRGIVCLGLMAAVAGTPAGAGSAPAATTPTSAEGEREGTRRRPRPARDVRAH